jgi:hypothetical protein
MGKYLRMGGMFRPDMLEMMTAGRRQMIWEGLPKSSWL